nr:truncated transcription factor CAULIFLOWER A-like [Ipomoea trifida]
MEKILERYERYSYAERRLLANNSESSENWTLEYAKLKAKVELLKRNHNALQNQLLYESLSELQKKERAIREENNMLAKKIKEKEKTAAAAAAAQPQAPWEQQNQVPGSSSFLFQQPSLPGLNMGGSYQGEAAAEEARRNNNDLDLNLDSLYPPCHLGCFAS